MRLRAAALAASVSLAPAADALSPAPAKPRRCGRLFTVRMGERAARAIYRPGHAHVTLRNLRLLGRIEMCQRNPRAQGFVRWFDRRHARLWKAARVSPAPWSSALASWYIAAGGPIACGGDSYVAGVASRTLPCGTRLRICYVGCVGAVVFDYGPAAWTGRQIDLSQAAADAIGFHGVDTVRYQVAAR